MQKVKIRIRHITDPCIEVHKKNKEVFIKDIHSDYMGRIKKYDGLTLKIKPQQKK